MSRQRFSPFRQQPKPSKQTALAASGPHQLPPLTTEQFKNCLRYVTRAALNNVRVPGEFFGGATLTGVLSSEDNKRVLLAAHAHFKGDVALAASFFYRYRALALLAPNPEIASWVMFEPDRDNFACYHEAMIDVAATLPMDQAGAFNAAAARDAAEAISGGFPKPTPAADLAPSIATADTLPA